MANGDACRDLDGACILSARGVELRGPQGWIIAEWGAETGWNVVSWLLSLLFPGRLLTTPEFYN
jgi:hypothetical protein